MRIGLNLLYLLPGVVGGTETYAAGLIHALSEVYTDDEFVIFINKETVDWPIPVKSNFSRVICPVDGSNRTQRYLFEQTRFPSFLRQYRIDLIHSLGYVGPINSPCPAVITIPDPNYIDLAQMMPIHRRLALRFVSTQAARTAKQIITISEFSKARLCQALKLPAKKIMVTHLASRLEETANTNENWLELRQRYGIQEPYIVAFGGGTVNKNIPQFIQAFAALKNQYPHNLVLIGRLPPNIDLKTISQDISIENCIIPTGYVPRNHISALLHHADLFVLPSLYEGFGLPVLEAQQADVAIACSIAGSLPEVAGQGAAFFDPTSVEAITQTMIRCLSNADLQVELRRLGQENLKRFSWEKTAVETLAVYHQVLNRSR